MKALVIFNLNERKYVVLRNAERCSKGNMMKLLMTSANDAWKNDEKLRARFTDYAEFVNKFFTLSNLFPITKVDISYNKEFDKWHIQSRNWIGNYREDQIIFADVEENYRPFAPMD